MRICFGLHHQLSVMRICSGLDILLLMVVILGFCVQGGS